MNVARTTRSIALCVSIFVTSGQFGWSQSSAPEKDQPGAQAGSSGKAPEKYGSKGGKASPVQPCDTGTTKKPAATSKAATTTKKQKSKKTEPAKTGS
jgi:hypothetical protein